MKLSDAIILGIGTVECMTAGDMNLCALGMALNAAGVPQLVDKYQNEARYQSVDILWPWTLEDYDVHSGKDKGIVRMSSYQSAIWATFDMGVMAGRMTIEELADWVRSVEPECGECCQFTCTCPKTVETQEVLVERTC